LFGFAKNGFRHWPATGNNPYFCRCYSEGISMGAEDWPGLFINRELRKGTSAFCKTYENEQ
jgi:hypothetical protein